MINLKSFKSKSGKILSVSRYKNTIVLNSKSQGSFAFDAKTFTEFKGFFLESAQKIWPSFNPKEATSIASDYDSYYDNEFDNEGYLSLSFDGIFAEGPDVKSNRLFKFNKRKAESFVFDFGR
jgi:hypothetical protein